MAYPQERPPSIFRRRHRTQVLVQIYLPLVLAALLLFIIPTVSLILTPNPLGVGSGQWAAIALIWLLAPFSVVIILVLMITVALIILLHRLMINLPSWTQLLRVWIERIGILVLSWCNRWAQPVIHVHGIWAAVRHAVIFLKRSFGTSLESGE
ncbi:MAG: hypothetical protein N3A60_08150 [Thermanaerothrix sp.]|nr:hypothetical protein [Thermanaerothrix sp.]